MIVEVSIFFKRLRCAIFCDKPYVLLPHEEVVEEGIFRIAKCPKCGLVCALLNRHDELLMNSVFDCEKE